MGNIDELIEPLRLRLAELNEQLTPLVEERGKIERMLAAMNQAAGVEVRPGGGPQARVLHALASGPKTASELRRSGSHQMVAYYCMKGCVERIERGKYALTAAGREYLRKLGVVAVEE